ncbi:hypothetical protein CBR_g50169 [Chara braunii]|uniref:Reverse transcriptase RNase H-like domain-containing protein n=1 Tax=Chara braunii TaxID=69332 RepID=A0A388M6C2_CHABU|nr:hypothetical protein CBR_g50169 [Chara braunii]|eukprot:GBG90076.1 hypothetical protein CBR_g50169 [Chara braunii]
MPIEVRDGVSVVLPEEGTWTDLELAYETVMLDEKDTFLWIETIWTKVSLTRLSPSLMDLEFRGTVEARGWVYLSQELENAMVVGPVLGTTPDQLFRQAEREVVWAACQRAKMEMERMEVRLELGDRKIMRRPLRTMRMSGHCRVRGGSRVRRFKGERVMARRRTFLEERPLGIEPPREVPGGVEVSLPAASEGWHHVADWVGVELAENMVYLVTKVEWRADENGEWNPDPRGHVRAEGRLYVSEVGWREFGVRLASREDPLSMFEGAWQLVWRAGFEFADPGVDDVTADLRVAMVGSFELPNENVRMRLPPFLLERLGGLGLVRRAVADLASLTYEEAMVHREYYRAFLEMSPFSGEQKYEVLRILCAVFSTRPRAPVVGSEVLWGVIRWEISQGMVYVDDLYRLLGKEMATEEGIDDQQSGGNQGTNGDGERNEGSTRDRESAKLEGTREDGKDASIGESSGKAGGSKKGPQENREGGNDMRTSPRNSAGATPKKTKVSDASRKLAEREKQTAEFKARLIEQMMVEDEEDPQGAGSREGRRAGQDETRGTPKTREKQRESKEGEGTSAVGEGGSSEGGLKKIVTTLTRSLSKNQGYLADAKKKLTFDGANITEFLIDYENLAALLKWTIEEKIEHLGQHVSLSLGRDIMAIVASSGSWKETRNEMMRKYRKTEKMAAEAELAAVKRKNYATYNDFLRAFMLVTLRIPGVTDRIMSKYFLRQFSEFDKDKILSAYQQTSKFEYTRDVDFNTVTDLAEKTVVTETLALLKELEVIDLTGKTGDKVKKGIESVHEWVHEVDSKMDRMENALLVMQAQVSRPALPPQEAVVPAAVANRGFGRRDPTNEQCKYCTMIGHFVRACPRLNHDIEWQRCSRSLKGEILGPRGERVNWNSSGGMRRAVILLNNLEIAAVNKEVAGSIRGAVGEIPFTGYVTKCAVRTGIRESIWSFQRMTAMEEMDHDVILGRQWCANVEMIGMHLHDGTYMVNIEDPVTGRGELLQLLGTGGDLPKGKLATWSPTFEESARKGAFARMEGMRERVEIMIEEAFSKKEWIKMGLPVKKRRPEDEPLGVMVAEKEQEVELGASLPKPKEGRNEPHELALEIPDLLQLVKAIRYHKVGVDPAGLAKFEDEVRKGYCLNGKIVSIQPQGSVRKYKPVGKKAKPVSILVETSKEEAMEKEEEILRVIRERRAMEGHRIPDEVADTMKIGVEGFLTAEETQLIKKSCQEFHLAFAFNDHQKGRLDAKLVPPVRIHTVQHECWNDKGPAYEFGIAAEVTDLLRAKIDSFVVEPTASPYENKWFVFRKPNKTLRWIQDLQKLNAVTIRDAGSLPQADLLAESHAGRSIYSLVDLYLGYDQLPLDARDRSYTAMHTPVGQLQMQVTAMGFTNAVAEAQRRMLAVAGDIFPEKCEPYIDDNPVKGARYKDETEIEPGVRNGPKSILAVPEVTILGFRCGAYGRRPDPAKTDKISQWPTPLRTTTKVRAFLGVVGFWRIFIRGFTKIAEPIRAMIREGGTMDWTEDREAAAQILKDILSSDQVTLAAPCFNDEVGRPFILETNGGPLAVGGVLIQRSEEGKERPIRSESRTLNSAERRYSQFKKEVLAILHCLKTFQAYLFGSRFILRIDPTNVAGTLKNYKPIDQTVGRWIGFIWQFDYKVERIAGLRNRADGLSRVCITPEGVEDVESIDAFLEYEGGTLVVDNEMADPAITTGQLLIHTLEKGAPPVVAELREGPVTSVGRKEEKDSWGAEVGAREELMAMTVEGGRDAVMTLAEAWAQKECQYVVNLTREEQGTDQKEHEFFLIQMYEGVFKEIGMLLVGNKQPMEVSPKAREEVEKPEEGQSSRQAGQSSSRKRKLYVGFDHNLVVNRGRRKQGTRGPSPLREGEPIELSSDSDPSSKEEGNPKKRQRLEEGNPEEGQRPGEDEPVEFIDLTTDEEEDEVTTPTREKRGRGEQPGEKKDKWIEEFGSEFSDWFDQWGTILRYQWIMKAREKLGRGEDLSPTTFFTERTLLQFQGIKRQMEQEMEDRARREAQRRPLGR